MSLPISRETLEGVLRPTAEANGLPNPAYQDAEFAAIEREQVLAGAWTAIATGHEIPNPGDTIPRDAAGQPLILLRGQDGAIRVFHNVCSHRGMTLIDKPCNVGKSVRCPYHSWTYDLEGSLRATPYIGGPRKNDCEGFDKSAHGLKPVRSAVWFDIVFVNMDGTAPDFADHIAPLAERWKLFDDSVLRHGGAGASITLDVNCNWKLAVENYCEAYHLPWVHPKLNMYSKLEDHYNIEESGLFAGQGTVAYAPALPEGGVALPDFPGLPAEWGRQAEYVALFPNMLLGIHKDHFYSVRIESLGLDRTREHMEIYYIGDGADDPAFAATRDANHAAWRSVFEEDIFAVEGMQRGRRSPAFGGGVFSPVMDTPTHCFHRWMADRLLKAAYPAN